MSLANLQFVCLRISAERSQMCIKIMLCYENARAVRTFVHLGLTTFSAFFVAWHNSNIELRYCRMASADFARFANCSQGFAQIVSHKNRSSIIVSVIRKAQYFFSEIFTLFMFVNTWQTNNVFRHGHH